MLTGASEVLYKTMLPENCGEKGALSCGACPVRKATACSLTCSSDAHTHEPDCSTQRGRLLDCRPFFLLPNFDGFLHLTYSNVKEPLSQEHVQNTIISSCSDIKDSVAHTNV